MPIRKKLYQKIHSVVSVQLLTVFDQNGKRCNSNSSPFFVCRWFPDGASFIQIQMLPKSSRSVRLNDREEKRQEFVGGPLLMHFSWNEQKHPIYGL